MRYWICRVRYWSGWVFLLASIGIVCPNTSSANPPAQIRAIYLGSHLFENQDDLFKIFTTQGINVVLLADRTFYVQEHLWQNIGERIDDSALSVMAVLQFNAPQHLRQPQGRYISYVNRDGVTYPNTICPADAAYWHTVIGDRFVYLAQIAPAAVKGLLWDTEMYGSEIAIYHDLCYCDTCWQAFVQTHSPLPYGDTDSRQIPADARFTYLQKHRLLQDYTTLQWDRVRTILSEIEQRVHQIRPHMQLGFLAYQYNWFYVALVHGLGTVETPALVFSESSYVRGYTPYVDRERDQVQGSHPIVQYIPGLWLDRFSPSDVPSQLLDLALNTDGYWIYPEKQAWEKLLQAPDTSSPEVQPNYWSAIQQVNTEINRLMQLPLVLYRKIPPVRQSSFYNTAQRRLVIPSALHEGLALAIALLQSSEYIVKAREYSDSALTYRGQTLFHCLPDDALASFTIEHVPLGKHTDPELVRVVPDTSVPISYLLFNGSGELLQKGQIASAASPQTISNIPGDQTLVSLLVDSGINGAQISFEGMTCVVEASSTFPLETYQSAFQTFLYVPAGTERLSFRAHSPQQESATITLRSGDGQHTQHVSTKRFTEFRIDSVFSDSPTLWGLQTAPTPSVPFGDLRVYLYDAEFPYVWIPTQ